MKAFAEDLEPIQSTRAAGVHVLTCTGEVQVHDPRFLPAEGNKGKNDVLPYQDPDRDD